MKKKAKEMPGQLHRLAQQLPRDIQPATDLWPQIEARLDAPSAEPNVATKRSGLWAAAAALVLVATSSLTTLILVRETGGPAPATAGLGPEPAVIGVGLRAPELLAISALSDEVRDVVITNLDIVRSARADIEQALQKDPNNIWLHHSWLRAYEQEMDLLNEAAWTTNSLAERLKT
jgi:hypothetical protein